MKHIMTDFWRIVSLQTFVVIGLACLATFYCLEHDVAIELPNLLIGIAIVFPIVFSINAAYRRREEALGHFSSLKSHCAALYYAHRDWTPQDSDVHTERMRDLMDRLLHAVHTYFTDPHGTNGHLQHVYDVFSELSLSMETLRQAGVSGSEISRCNQYLKSMMTDFERMRNIRLYRTPTSLRAYSHLFLNAFPVLYAPYFAFLSIDSTYTVTGYVVAVIYGLVLVSLDNIQEDLENPYDQVGADDLSLDVAEYYVDILK